MRKFSKIQKSGKWRPKKRLPSSEEAARSLAVRQMAQSPYLLTLLCWAGQRRTIDPRIRRTSLYEYAVKDLLGLTRTGAVEEGRGSDWMPMMREVGLSLYADHAAKQPIQRERLLELMENCQRRPVVGGLRAEQAAQLGVREKASYLLQELLEKRFLVTSGVDEFMVPHRSLLEYLAGAGLAEKLKGASASGWWRWADAKAWDPEWREVIVFTAGSLVMSWRPLKELLHRLSLFLKPPMPKHQ